MKDLTPPQEFPTDKFNKNPNALRRISDNFYSKDLKYLFAIQLLYIIVP